MLYISYQQQQNIYPLLHIAHPCFFFQWKEILEKTLADLDKEIADLSEAKELTEDALEAKNIPTDTVVENLTIREGRHGIDIVQDEVENQLHKVCVHLYVSGGGGGVSVTDIEWVS